MAGLKKLPIGIENFEEIRQEDFYYVDKTRVIEQLLTEWGKQKNNQHTGHFCAKADKIKVWNCLL
ncbi:AAA family ATPase [Blautia sp. MSJ-9]|nr:AAA family ATPase [Blautia sp. MSJ-9]